MAGNFDHHGGDLCLALGTDRVALFLEVMDETIAAGRKAGASPLSLELAMQAVLRASTSGQTLATVFAPLLPKGRAAQQTAIGQLFGMGTACMQGASQVLKVSAAVASAHSSAAAFAGYPIAAATTATPRTTSGKQLLFNLQTHQRGNGKTLNDEAASWQPIAHGQQGDGVGTNGCYCHALLTCTIAAVMVTGGADFLAIASAAVDEIPGNTLYCAQLRALARAGGGSGKDAGKSIGLDLARVRGLTVRTTPAPASAPPARSAKVQLGYHEALNLYSGSNSRGASGDGDMHEAVEQLIAPFTTQITQVKWFARDAADPVAPAGVAYYHMGWQQVVEGTDALAQGVLDSRFNTESQLQAWRICSARCDGCNAKVQWRSNQLETAAGAAGPGAGQLDATAEAGEAAPVLSNRLASVITLNGHIPFCGGCGALNGKAVVASVVECKESYGLRVTQEIPSPLRSACAPFAAGIEIGGATFTLAAVAHQSSGHVVATHATGDSGSHVLKRDCVQTGAHGAPLNTAQATIELPVLAAAGAAKDARVRASQRHAQLKLPGMARRMATYARYAEAPSGDTAGIVKVPHTVLIGNTAAAGAFDVQNVTTFPAGGDWQMQAAAALQAHLEKQQKPPSEPADKGPDAGDGGGGGEAGTGGGSAGAASGGHQTAGGGATGNSGGSGKAKAANGKSSGRGSGQQNGSAPKGAAKTAAANSKAGAAAADATAGSAAPRSYKDVAAAASTMDTHEAPTPAARGAKRKLSLSPAASGPTATAQAAASDSPGDAQPAGQRSRRDDRNGWTVVGAHKGGSQPKETGAAVVRQHSAAESPKQAGAPKPAEEITVTAAEADAGRKLAAAAAARNREKEERQQQREKVQAKDAAAKQNASQRLQGGDEALAAALEAAKARAPVTPAAATPASATPTNVVAVAATAAAATAAEIPIAPLPGAEAAVVVEAACCPHKPLQREPAPLCEEGGAAVLTPVDEAAAASPVPVAAQIGSSMPVQQHATAAVDDTAAAKALPAEASATVACQAASVAAAALVRAAGEESAAAAAAGSEKDKTPASAPTVPVRFGGPDMEQLPVLIGAAGSHRD